MVNMIKAMVIARRARRRGYVGVIYDFPLFLFIRKSSQTVWLATKIRDEFVLFYRGAVFIYYTDDVKPVRTSRGNEVEYVDGTMLPRELLRVLS